MRVIVSFCPDYGDRKNADLGDAFWLIESPVNRRLAQTGWASGLSDPNSAHFGVSYGPGETDSAIAIFENVDLHHPNWTEIDFDAVVDVARLSLRLSEFGFFANPRTNGLVVTRKPTKV